MNPERLAQATAPWATWTPDTDQPEAVIQTLSDQGELDGTVAVFSNARDQGTLDDTVLPALEDVGVDPVEVGVVDAPADDQAAMQSNVNDHQRALPGRRRRHDRPGGLQCPGLADLRRAPTPPTARSCCSSTSLGARAFATNAATTDTSVLESSLSGGSYGPDQERFDEAGMQECIQTLTDAGLETPVARRGRRRPLEPALPGRLPGLPGHGPAAGVAGGRR